MFQQFCFRTEFLHQTQLSITFLLFLILIYLLLLLFHLLLLIPLLLLWSESQVEGGEGCCKGWIQMEKLLWGSDNLCEINIYKYSKMELLMMKLKSKNGVQKTPVAGTLQHYF